MTDTEPTQSSVEDQAENPTEYTPNPPAEDQETHTTESGVTLHVDDKGNTVSTDKHGTVRIVEGDILDTVRNVAHLLHL